MRLPLALSLAFATAVMIGCGNNQPSRHRGSGGNQGLSADDAAKITSINQTLSDQNDAIDLAFSDKSFDASEKAREMAKLLNRTDCPDRHDGGLEDDFSKSWSQTQEIGQAETCPLKLRRTWELVRNEKEKLLRFGENISSVAGSEFRKLSGLTQRVSTGFLSVSGSLSSKERIQGHVRYSAFELEGEGHFIVDISTDQVYREGAELGSLAIRVTGGGFNHVGRIQWTNRAQLHYSVDFQALSEKDFFALFSGFGVREIMAISQKMR
jgi:hypothetical protein